VQHELRPGVSLTGGYYRNWSSHFRSLPRGDFSTVYTTDNLAVTPADYQPYCITAPTDSRLPGGGGYQVCGLYDIVPAKFGQSQELVRRPEHYDNGKYRYSDFVAASIRTRFGKGIELGGSVDTGRTMEDNCFVVDSPGVTTGMSSPWGGQSATTINGEPICRVVTPFGGQTQIKVHAVYPLPGEVMVSAIFDNVSGTPYEANYTASNAEVARSLGRSLAACGTRPTCTATVSVPLIAPQTQFEKRRNLFDLRLTKQFVIGARARLRANFDIYNLFNDASILGTNNNYGANWLRPEGTGGGLRSARLIQFGANFSF
jgi:hypothetical protein